MNTLLKLSLISLLSLTVAPHSQAITLPDALGEALKTSPVIQKYQSAKAEAYWKKVESTSTYLPSLSAQATYLFDKKYALTNVRFGSAATDTIVPQVIPNGQLALTATYPLFEGFAGESRLKAASQIEEAAIKEAQWSQFKIEMGVTLLFYKTLASKSLKEIAEQNLKILKDHLKEIQLFKKNGMATNYDVLRVEVQVSNAESELLNAEDSIAINTQNLIELLGIDESLLEVSGELPNITQLEAINFEAMNSGKLSERPDLLALKKRSQSFGHLESAQSKFWIPKVTLFGQYQIYNNLNTSLTDSYRNAYQAGLQVSWNIFDGLSSFAKSKQSTEQFIQNEKNYRLNEMAAKKDLEIWKRKILFNSSLYKARKSDISKSEESVRLAREGRRVGSRSNTDLLDAEADLYKSQAGAINAHIGTIEALINYQMTTGKKLSIFK